MSKEICWLEEGHNLFPLEYRLSAGKPFPQKPRKCCLPETQHLFSQNPATNTENSAQSRSEHIFTELTLFVYNINTQYFCIKSGLNYLRYKRYKRNETEGHIFFCNLNFHRNGIYILYTLLSPQEDIYFTLIGCFIMY